MQNILNRWKHLPLLEIFLHGLKTAYVFTAALFFVSVCVGQQIKHTILVVEYEGNSVSFYDSQTGRRLGTTTVGLRPHEIEMSTDGRTAFVTNFGLADYDYRIGTPGNSISVLDVGTMKEKYRLLTENLKISSQRPVSGKAPHGVKLRPPSQQELFVNTEVGGDLMLVYDLGKKRLKRSFAVPAGTHNLIFSPDGNSLFLLAGVNGVYKISPDSGKIIAHMKLESPARGLSYTNDKRAIMAAGRNELALLNPVTLSINRHFKDLGVGQILYPRQTPDGRHIMLPAPNDSKVLVLEASTGRVVHRLKTGKTPLAFAFSPDGRWAYVSSDLDDHFSRIDLRTFEFKEFAKAAGSNGVAVSRVAVKAR